MFSSNIIVHVIALLNIAACYDVTSTHSRPKSIPLNFKDAIAHLHAQKQLVDHHEQLKAVSEHFSHQFGHISKMFASFRSSTATDSQMGQLMPLLQSETNVSVECIRQIKQVWTGLESGSYFAEKMLDSFGKPSSGILNGNTAWLGEFSECRNISNENGNLTGKYVLVTKPFDAEIFYRPDLSVTLKYGICVPNLCSQDDIYQIINYFLSMLPSNVTHPSFLKINFTIEIDDVQVIDTNKELDSEAVLVLIIIGVIVAIVMTGTLVDGYMRYVHYAKCRKIAVDASQLAENSELNNVESTNKQSFYQFSVAKERLSVRVLASFSVYSNTIKLFQTSQGNDQLKCLDAIRFLSLAWVILGHSFIFNIAVIDNPLLFADWFRSVSFMFISNAFFCVDTFFLLSGLLTSYAFLRQIEKQNNKVTFGIMVKYYLHRIWRILPPYAIALVASVYLSGYLGSGPNFPNGGFEPDICRDVWWRNVFFLNNIVNPDQWCFVISWYLANDFQFHLMAPLVIVPLALGKKILGLIISFGLLIGNTFAIALTLYFNEGAEMAQYGEKQHVFFTGFYMLPWCRIGPYVVGLLCGYVIFLHKKNKTIKISRTANMCMWAVSIAMCVFVIYGLYPDVQGEHPLSRTTHILYQSFSKLFWSISVSFMIYSCVSNSGGVINDLLSLRIWSPLSRLSYSAILVHVFVVLYFTATQEHLIHLQLTTMIYIFVGNVTFSFVVAYFFSLFFEIPLIGLEKFIFKR